MTSNPPLKCTCASFFTVRGVHKIDCPAYTPPVEGESWIKEFDKKFPRITSLDVKENGAWSLNYDGYEIKSFITTLLHSERAKERERIAKMCEGMKVFTPRSAESATDYYNVGINKALIEIINLITDKEV